MRTFRKNNLSYNEGRLKYLEKEKARMLKFTRRDKRTELEKEVDKRLDELLKDSMTPEEVGEVIDLMNKRQSPKEKKAVSPDTMAVVIGNLLGIVMILSYEKANVITSKALGFVLRGRV
jgi:NTP pyrophosphatase (non-canonical NTP hydrolase)